MPVGGARGERPIGQSDGHACAAAAPQKGPGPATFGTGRMAGWRALPALLLFSLQVRRSRGGRTPGAGKGAAGAGVWGREDPGRREGAVPRRAARVGCGRSRKDPGGPEFWKQRGNGPPCALGSTPEQVAAGNFSPTRPAPGGTAADGSAATEAAAGSGRRGRRGRRRRGEAAEANGERGADFSGEAGGGAPAAGRGWAVDQGSRDRWEKLPEQRQRKGGLGPWGYRCLARLSRRSRPAPGTARKGRRERLFLSTWTRSTLLVQGGQLIYFNLGGGVNSSVA